MSDSESSWESDHDESIASFRSFTTSADHGSLRGSLEEDARNGFDVLEILRSVNAREFYDVVKCVNFIREAFSGGGWAEGKDTREMIEGLGGVVGEGEGEKYFKMFLEEDGYVLCCDDLLVLIGGDSDSDSVLVSNSNAKAFGKNGDGDGDGDGDEKEVEHLRKQLSAAQDLISRLLEGKDGDSDGDSDSNNPPLPPNNTKSPKKHDRRKTNDKDNGNDNDNDTYYFDSYSSTTIHKTMLSDSVRTDAYRLAILSNPLLFKDLVVLDVGCGTGILSMFCCAAGARKVIGVDDSEMASKAREIVRRNGMEGRVEIVRGKMEDLDLAPYLPEDHPTVDVIVSEWMGYALLYESMLPSVISARERYLTPDRGIMWPNKCRMFIEAVRDPVDVDFWGDVYGFDMSPMTPLARRERTRKGEAAVEVVDKGTVCSDRCMFWGADLTEVKDRELDFEREFHLELNQDLEGGDEDKDDGKDDGKDKAEATNAMNAMNAMNAFVISFDIDFVGPQKSVSFSTGCQSPPTHWAQSLLWIEPSLVKSGLKKITGKLQLTRNDRNQRDIDITIEWRDGERDQNSKSAILGKQKWSLKS